MRVLAVDLGKVRIGIAVGESEFGIVTPRANVPAIGTLTKDAVIVAELARNEGAQFIVVGKPVNEEDSRMANVCERFADHLRGLGWEVETVDESFTSVAADRNLQDLKGSLRRKRKDGEAAALILERYFERRSA